MPSFLLSLSAGTERALVLWGARDGHFPPAHAHRLHAAIPGARLQIVPDGHHWLVWDQAELVAAAVRELQALILNAATSG